jgi:hypothetical protein
MGAKDERNERDVFAMVAKDDASFFIAHIGLTIATVAFVFT